MPPAVPPPATPLVVPPASAVIVWALATNLDVIRCLAWEDENIWWIAIIYGKDTLKIQRVPDLETLWYVSDLFQRGLASSFDFLTVGVGPKQGARCTRARRRRTDTELVRSGDR